VAQKPHGELSRTPVGWGLHRGWGLPVTASPACWLKWPALVGQLPVGVRGSHGSFAEPVSTPFFWGMSNRLVGAIWSDQWPVRISGGSCALCYSCQEFLVSSICWEFSRGGWRNMSPTPFGIWNLAQTRQSTDQSLHWRNAGLRTFDGAADIKVRSQNVALCLITSRLSVEEFHDMYKTSRADLSQIDQKAVKVVFRVY